MELELEVEVGREWRGLSSSKYSIKVKALIHYLIRSHLENNHDVGGLAA